MKKKCRYLQQHHPPADFLSGDPVSIPLAAVVCGGVRWKKESLQMAEKEEKNEKKMEEHFQHN